MEENMVQFIYAVLSILVVGLVIVFGVSSMSNYMPEDKKEDQQKEVTTANGNPSEGGEPDAPAD